MILSVRRQHRNKSVPVHEKRSFPKDCEEYTTYTPLRQAFPDTLLKLLKLDNNVKWYKSIFNSKKCNKSIWGTRLPWTVCGPEMTSRHCKKTWGIFPQLSHWIVTAMSRKRCGRQVLSECRLSLITWRETATTEMELKMRRRLNGQKAGKGTVRVFEG